MTSMANPVDILKQIKAIVFNEQPQVVEQKFDEYTLADGTPVMVTELVVGGVVTLADGSAAPAGDHTLADGTVITVGEGGVISNIMAPAEPVAVEEPSMPEAEDMGKKYEDKMAAMEQRMGNMEQALAKAEEALRGLIGLVETLVKEPATEPVEPVKNGFKHAKKNDRAERIAKLFNNIKK